MFEVNIMTGFRKDSRLRRRACFGHVLRYFGVLFVKATRHIENGKPRFCRLGKRGDCFRLQRLVMLTDFFK